MKALTSRVSRRVTVAGFVTVAVVAGACGLGSSGAGPTPSGTATSVPVPAASSPSPTGPVLPAGWTLCVNAARGSSMGYPATWHQPDPALPAAEVCSAFQPNPFAIPPNSDYHLIALNARQYTETVATYITQVTDPVFNTTLLNEVAPPVAGLTARRFEVSSNGEGLDEAGTKTYGYAINRGGHAFVVWTIAAPGETAYAGWKTVVDQAVATLTFS